MEKGRIQGRIGAALGPCLALQPESPAFVGHVERDPLEAQVLLDARDHEVEQPAAAGDRSHLPGEGGEPLEARRVPTLALEDLAAAQEGRGRAREDGEDLHVVLGEAPGLVAGHQQAEDVGLGQERHEHDRVEVAAFEDLGQEAGVAAHVVRDVGPTGPEAPAAPRIRLHREPEPARRFVGEAVHGQRGGDRLGQGIVECYGADGSADESGQALGHHPVELFRLGDERPVTADLVEKGQVAGSGPGRFAVPQDLVVERLQAQEGADLEDQGRRVGGLLEKIVGPGFVPAPHRTRVPEGGQHDDRQRGPVSLADAHAGLEPVHPGQAHVQEHEVEPLLTQPIERGLARVRARGFEAVVAEQLHHGPRDVGVVFDDQDLGQGHSGRRASVALRIQGRQHGVTRLESCLVGRQNAVRAVTFAAALAALPFASAPPRVLWQNAGPSIQYPLVAWVGALAAALALAGLSLSLPKGRSRAVALVPAGALALWSGHLLAYRLNATERGLTQRSLAGSSAVAWREVTGVELEASHIRVHGPNGTLEIPSQRIAPEDRARLERTISREVREAAAAQNPAR